MRNNAKGLRAQSTLEYAVVIACIVGALLSMQVYIKRAISGKLRLAADDIGQQYDPRNTTTSAGGMTTSIDSNVTTKVETETSTTDDEVLETTTTVTINSEEEKVYGSETVGPLGSSL